MKIVPDTSVIIDGRLSDILDSMKDTSIELIIPEAVFAELEHQANLGRETGFEGLRELKLLREMADSAKERITFRVYGERPGKSRIDMADRGEIDALIREIAYQTDSKLITSDRTQSLVAQAKGIPVEYIGPRIKKLKPRLFELFDGKTMSVHLKENTPGSAKRGSVGEFHLVSLGKTPMTSEDMEDHIKEVTDFTYSDPDSRVELEKQGVLVIQAGKYRIVIARPPFSEGLEITAVKPLVKMRLDEYNPPKKLIERLERSAEGIFVSGSPGAGKTTFVQSLAEFYLEKGKIVKTMEHPRDLQVPAEITQYRPLEGSIEATGDILLLVRPDYTIFDEVRKTRDFQVFADMRLAGVGLIGVTHANKPIDAIQRLIGRVELGVIPHIVDTVIYLEDGKIAKIYELRMSVKVPHGMREADLARPVVEVCDFIDGKSEYELYSYGEEVVVIPLIKKKRPPERLEFKLTKKHIMLRTNEYRGEDVRVFGGGEFICKAHANSLGNIKIKKGSTQYKMILDALNAKQKITIT